LQKVALGRTRLQATAEDRDRKRSLTQESSVRPRKPFRRLLLPSLAARANLPNLIKAQVGMGQRVLGDVETVVKLGADLPQALGEAGAQAVACVAAGAQASVEASARIRVSFEASANVSGKVGAKM
jgi:hypothetical protein